MGMYVLGCLFGLRGGHWYSSGGGGGMYNRVTADTKTFPEIALFSSAFKSLQESSADALKKGMTRDSSSSGLSSGRKCPPGTVAVFTSLKLVSHSTFKS